MTGGSPEREGVIRFEADHLEEPLPESWNSWAEPLLKWRRLFRLKGWLGQSPDRYGGYGFGNLSVRLPQGFLITGSQTSGLRTVGIEDFVHVSNWSVEDHWVGSRGAKLPSSESLSHAILYDLTPDVRAVFHVHAPKVFRASLENPSFRLPTTATDVEAGTPEMALEISRLWHTATPKGFGGGKQGVLVMGGHPDGILVFGGVADEAGRCLMRAEMRAGRHA